jgi:hypothetical protein
VETYFKVVADKPVAVLMHGGRYYFSGGADGWLNGAGVFYPSTDGGFAGKEFIFLTSMAQTDTVRSGWTHVVYAIEDSKVSVYDSKGALVRTVTLKGNESTQISLGRNMIYRVVSTGRIMIGCWGLNSLMVIPSRLGGYKDMLFYANPEQVGEIGNAILIILGQDVPAHVRIVDIATGTTIKEKDLAPRELWYVNRNIADLNGKRLRIESTGNILVIAGSNAVERPRVDPVIPNPNDIMLACPSIMFVGVKPGESLTTYATAKIVVFSPETNARITVEELSFNVERGFYMELPLGLITLTSNATIIVQSIFRTDLYSFATYLIPAKMPSIVYPPPAKGGEESTIVYYPLTIAAIVVVVIAVFLMRKRMRKPGGASLR